MNNPIIQAAKAAHKKYWQATSDESTGDKQSLAVTKAWQNAVMSNDVQAEVSIAECLREKIDVVDFSSATAYEMKVSGKNPQHEFYKDIFKVIVYNQYHTSKLKNLVFITEQQGAKKLSRGLGKAVTESASQYNLNITVIGI